MRGAPANERGRCLWIASSTCSRSKRGMSTIALPVATETPMITVRPYTWKSGMTSTPRSSPSTSVGFHERDCSTFATSARCDRTAPFGTPVVPPVYWRIAVSSGRTSTGRRAAPSRRRFGKNRSPAARSIVARYPSRRSRDGVETRERDERLRPGVRELPAQLGSGVQGVARDDDRARSQRAVEGDDELRAVGQKQRDAVPFADAQRLEARREAVREPLELGVRERSFDESMPDDRAEDRCDRPRMTRGGVGEELLEGNGGIVERVRHAGVVLLQPRALGRYPDAQPQPPARYRSTRNRWSTNTCAIASRESAPGGCVDNEKGAAVAWPRFRGGES